MSPSCMTGSPGHNAFQFSSTQRENELADVDLHTELPCLLLDILNRARRTRRGAGDEEGNGKE